MIFPFRKKKKRSVSQTTAMLPEMDYKAVAMTDVGAVRSNNEDNLVFIRPFDEDIRRKQGFLALVADGMGGHNSGEIASQMAADIVARHYYDHHDSVLNCLETAFDTANKAIFQKAGRDASLKGMGTTCTAVVLLNHQIYLGHVGDSRAYLLKNNRMIQLTKDHTYVQHLLDSGQITYEESLDHPQKNVITRAMGTSSALRADFFQHEVSFEADDKLLVCSDGLYEYFGPEEMKGILQEQSAADAASHFIELAKKRGGHDNISVLIVQRQEPSSDQQEKKTGKRSLS